MEIREAGDADIPAIVQLLKTSLGESLLPKSEAYWKWKHVDNPFGSSPVLLATDGGKITGVRAFMRWTWLRNGESLPTVRAVDTATHPDFQGKGIFSSLTKALLKRCAEEGTALIFNTPNEKSLPGYLKMGWETAGRLPVVMNIRRPAAMAVRTLMGKKTGDVSQDSNVDILSHPHLGRLLEDYRNLNSEKYITLHTPSTLKWRYLDVPVEKYFAEGIELSGELKAVVIYRLKETRFGREFRITEYISGNNEMDKLAAKLIKKLAIRHRADYITSEALTGRDVHGILTIKRNGPIVTVRKLNGPGLENFRHFLNWRPSLGDLELF